MRNGVLTVLTLYHYWDSTCSMKVRFALAEKGLDYDGVFVDLLKFEQLQDAYLQINPNGVAPSLVHDGQSIVESTVINEYLEEVFPRSFVAARRPAGPGACQGNGAVGGRARARRLS